MQPIELLEPLTFASYFSLSHFYHGTLFFPPAFT